MTMADIKAGITLFSLGTAYLKGELDLEGVIRTAAEMGAEGYEIVASQMIPSYPYVSDEFVEFINEMNKVLDNSGKHYEKMAEFVHSHNEHIMKSKYGSKLKI